MIKNAGGKIMIIDLPKTYSTGKISCPSQMAYVESGELRVGKDLFIQKTMYELTYQLYGGKHKCFYCGKEFFDKKVTIDHRYPQYTGGPTITNNLIPACYECNHRKSNMTEEQYYKFLALENEKERKDYYEDLQWRKQILNQEGRFEFPLEWISTKEMNRIFVPTYLTDFTKSKKYEKIENYYRKFGHLPKAILVSNNDFLLDGYYIINFAKMNQIKEISIILLENVKIIL